MSSTESTSPSKAGTEQPRPAGAHPCLPVSVFLIACNEEARIAAAIDSVNNWATEVLVVDSGSTDATIQIAQQHGAKVIHNPWPGYGAQKRFAEDQCTAPWLFNLDADELATPQLAEEIAALFTHGAPEHDAYSIFIADVFPHEHKPAPWASGKWQIRLYDRQQGRFSPSPVHDSVRMQTGARTTRLHAPIHHRSQPSLRFAVDKMNRYSDMQITDMQTRQRRIPAWRLMLEFPLATLKCYFLRRACLYGWWGIIHAINYGFSRHLRIAKAYEAELTRRKRPDPET